MYSKTLLELLELSVVGERASVSVLQSQQHEIQAGVVLYMVSHQSKHAK
jgi:hypothetical protein